MAYRFYPLLFAGIVPSLGQSGGTVYDVVGVKNPSPEGPPQLPARRAYSSERGVEFTLDSKWNNGMME